MVLSRPCHPEDQFTTSVLRHWASKHDDTLGEHIKAQLIKNNNQPRKRQRYRPNLTLPLTLTFIKNNNEPYKRKRYLHVAEVSDLAVDHDLDSGTDFNPKLDS